MAVKLGVFYHFFPHYRGGFIRALRADESLRTTFFADISGREGIEPYEFGNASDFIEIPATVIGHFEFQPKLLWIALSYDLDVVLLFANPYFITTWIAALIFRCRNKHVIFWGHGWLKKQSRFRDAFKTIFFSIPHDICVYNFGAQSLAQRKGFRNVHVFFNSLDLASQVEIRERIERGELKPPDIGRFRRPAAALVVCSARLTLSCRFELLIDAAAILERSGCPIDIILIGDGPERAQLEALADAREVNVLFFGACYDETVLGPLIYGADMTVSPGKVGLTAIQSMTYGVPVITHCNVARQMPEHEAIIPDVTGAYFDEGGALSLSKVMREWVNKQSERIQIRLACYKQIDEHFNPAIQLQLLKDVIMARSKERPNSCFEN